MTSCAVGASAERQQEDAKLRDMLPKVQEAACLKPATAPACASDLHLSYEWPGHGGRTEMWCTAGRPQVKSEDVDAPMPLAVWDAIERVVFAADGCVLAYGARVAFTWKAHPDACPDPRFDIHELLELAHDAAQEGPRPTPHVRPPASQKCAPFTGPLWLDVESPPVGEPAGPR